MFAVFVLYLKERHICHALLVCFEWAMSWSKCIVSCKVIITLQPGYNILPFFQPNAGHVWPWPVNLKIRPPHLQVKQLRSFGSFLRGIVKLDRIKNPLKKNIFFRLRIIIWLVNFKSCLVLWLIKLLSSVLYPVTTIKVIKLDGIILYASFGI